MKRVFVPLHLLALGKVEDDTRQLRISRAWHVPNRFEFQWGGMVQSTGTTAGFGPVLRWNFLQRKRWPAFYSAGVHLLQTGSTAYIIPWFGVGYNFFVRGGGGAALGLHEWYWLEPSFGWAHVTFGFGGSSQLFPWSGQGVSLGLPHTFPRTPAKSSLDNGGSVPSFSSPNRGEG